MRVRMRMHADLRQNANTEKKRVTKFPLPFRGTSAISIFLSYVTEKVKASFMFPSVLVRGKTQLPRSQEYPSFLYLLLRGTNTVKYVLELWDREVGERVFVFIRSEARPRQTQVYREPENNQVPFTSRNKCHKYVLKLWDQEGERVWT